MQTSTLTPAHTYHSNKNTHICKQRPQTEASSSNISCCFLVRLCCTPWSNLSHSENLQCRLPSFRCLLGGQDEDCIIYDEANQQQVIGTKQTREQPLIAEWSNQTVPLHLVTPHDTSFHFKHRTLHPSLLRASERTQTRVFRIGSPKGGRLGYLLQMLV